jgi:hypothetical protein
VLIGGSEAATDDLAKCPQFKSTRAILTPAVMEDIDVTSDTSVYPVREGRRRGVCLSNLAPSKVKLKDALVESLAWVQEGECEMAYVYGQLQVTAGGPALLAEIPVSLIPGHRAVYVGEVKLPEIRSAMQRSGMQAELAQVRRGVAQGASLTARQGHLARESCAAGEEGGGQGGRQLRSAGGRGALRGLF